jgi:hypothetical protein
LSGAVQPKRILEVDMFRFTTLSVLGFVTLLSGILLGCGEKDAAVAPGEMPAADAGASAIEKALASLSAEDRELVVMMGDCPVSGEPLGSMGTPLKVTKGDRSLFICCESCRELAEKNFDDYIAKIDAKKAAAEPAEAPAS